MMPTTVRTSMPDSLNLAPQREGPLRKRNSRGAWQSRWWVLRGSELRYFTDQKSTSAKGVVSMETVLSSRSMSMVDREPFCLEIRCRERTYHLSAPSAHDAAQWVAAIEAARQHSAMRTGMGSSHSAKAILGGTAGGVAGVGMGVVAGSAPGSPLPHSPPSGSAQPSSRPRRTGS